MKNALLLHGTASNHEGNWFPWLKKELEKDGWQVWVPDLPAAEKPSMRRYNDFIFANKNWKFTDRSILIGHSSGAVAILGLLQELPEGVKVNTCYLVGAFKDDLGWNSLKNLFDINLDFKKIRKKAKKFIFIHSDNDPHCPLDGAQYLASELGAELIIKPGQGHFNLAASSDYIRFPFLLELITQHF